MSDRFTLTHISQLADDAAASRYVLVGFAHALGNGDIPADRPPPTGGEQCTLLFDGETPIGFATYYRPEDHDFLWLDLLWVHPDHRSRGQGRRLIRAVEQAAVLDGASGVRFGTLLTNSTMPIIARMMGFEQQSITYSKAVT